MTSMKLDSYWNDSVPALALDAHDLPAQADVVIVGGGFTGLSAALALARRGASVVVLEAGGGWRPRRPDAMADT